MKRVLGPDSNGLVFDALEVGAWDPETWNVSRSPTQPRPGYKTHSLGRVCGTGLSLPRANDITLLSRGPSVEMGR